MTLPTSTHPWLTERSDLLQLRFREVWLPEGWNLNTSEKFWTVFIIIFALTKATERPPLPTMLHRPPTLFFGKKAFFFETQDGVVDFPVYADEPVQLILNANSFHSLTTTENSKMGSLPLHLLQQDFLLRALQLRTSKTIPLTPYRKTSLTNVDNLPLFLEALVTKGKTQLCSRWTYLCTSADMRRSVSSLWRLSMQQTTTSWSACASWTRQIQQQLLIPTLP